MAGIPDDFANTPPALSDGEWTLGLDVTASDDTDLAFKPRAITCRVAGLVALQWVPGGTPSIHSIAVGVPLKARPIRIFATGTTATGLAILK
jgi:hypothetical protein